MFKFEKLQIWRDSIEYGKKVYKTTEKFPNSEQFGLTSQLKRAAVSISSNIAEGSGSPSNKNFSHFLDISMESLIETVSQLMFAKELEYISETTLIEHYNEAEILMKKMQSFKKSLFR
jgi:four helix bundle protein